MRCMMPEQLIGACKAAGLKVTKNDAIKDMLCTYGIIKEYQILHPRTQEPFEVNIADIEDVAYNPESKKIMLTMIDGSEFTLKGMFEYDDSGDVIINTTRMPKEQSELDDIFDLVYPDIESKLYYDVLAEQGMVDPTLFNITDELDIKEGQQFVPYTDEMVPFYYDSLERRLRKMGFTGKCPTDKVRDMVLKKRMLQQKRNLFLEWVTSHKWDGKPRMRRWFMDGLGAEAPALTPEEEERYIGDATENWFKGAIMRMHREGKVEVVPVLIGGEGIGKGNFLKYTAGWGPEWYAETSLSLEGPGAEEKFMESIKGAIIVELSESIQFTTVKGTELLKTFVSKTRDKRRKAYAREPTVSIRRFVLAATSNRNNVFLDVGGGSRRYYPFYCNPNKAINAFDPTYQVIGRYEVEQVWAEAYEEFMKDPLKDPFPSKEAAELASIMQEYGTVENTNVNRIEEWLNDPSNGYSEVGATISKEEIYYNILGVSIKDHGVIPVMAEQTYTEWTNIQKCWRKLPKTLVRGNKRKKNVFERIYREEEVQVKRRANMVNVLPGHETEFVDVKRIMRERALEYGYSKFDDPFPTTGLTPEIIAELCDQGYIYESSLDNETPHYFVYMMP